MALLIHIMEILIQLAIQQKSYIIPSIYRRSIPRRIQKRNRKTSSGCFAVSFSESIYWSTVQSEADTLFQ
jgi:hypothetical protein